jgi:ApaG protein
MPFCSNLPHMQNQKTYTAITRSIAVSVEPTYLDDRSSPAHAQYVWAYRVTIENRGQETVQLLNRHWMITNARGEYNEVKGPGVVGQQPILQPGERHVYTSGVPLDTSSGMMAGSYEMQSDRGERFDIEIPAFSLDSPNQAVRPN